MSMMPCENFLRQPALGSVVGQCLKSGIRMSETLKQGRLNTGFQCLVVHVNSSCWSPVSQCDIWPKGTLVRSVMERALFDTPLVFFFAFFFTFHRSEEVYFLLRGG